MAIDLRNKLNQFAVLTGVVILGGGYGFWQYIYVPKQEQITELTAEQEKLSNELTVVRTQRQRLAQLKAELNQAEADFAKLQEMFPDEEQIPTRLQDLLTVTRRAGTTTTRFQPLPAVQKDYYAENNYKISITGSYHAMGEMFSEIANFKYPTSIQKMSIEVSPRLKDEVDYADKHGTVPNSVVTDFEFTTYTSRK